MSNTGSDADGFVTEAICSNQSKNISPTIRIVLEDCVWRSSSGEKMIGILPWKND